MVSNLSRNLEDADKVDTSGVSGTNPSDLPVETQNISMSANKEPVAVKFKRKVSGFFRNNKADLKYMLLVIPIVATFFLARMVQNNQTLSSHAGSYTAAVSFQLDKWTLPPESTFGIWVNASGSAAFTSIEFDFDPNLVKITKEITLTSTVLTRVIKVTPMSEANSTGKVFLVLGLDPTKLGSAPSGAFQVADVTFGTVTTNSNVSTSINFKTSNMHIVATDQSSMGISATDMSLTLNPVATPTPTTTVSPSPTTNPTATPAPTSTPKSKGRRK